MAMRSEKDIRDMLALYREAADKYCDVSVINALKWVLGEDTLDVPEIDEDADDDLGDILDDDDDAEEDEGEDEDDDEEDDREW